MGNRVAQEPLEEEISWKWFVIVEIEELTMMDFKTLLVRAHVCLDDPGVLSNHWQHQYLRNSRVNLCHK